MKVSKKLKLFSHKNWHLVSRSLVDEHFGHSVIGLRPSRLSKVVHFTLSWLSVCYCIELNRLIRIHIVVELQFDRILCSLETCATSALLLYHISSISTKLAASTLFGYFKETYLSFRETQVFKLVGFAGGLLCRFFSDRCLLSLCRPKPLSSKPSSLKSVWGWCSAEWTE